MKKFEEIYRQIINEDIEDTLKNNQFYAIAKEENNGEYKFLQGYDLGYSYCLVTSPEELSIGNKYSKKEDAIKFLNYVKTTILNQIKLGKEPGWTDLEYHGDPNELNELKVVKVTIIRHKPTIKIEEV